MLKPRVARVWCLLCLAVTVAACSGGGGGSDTPIIPWGRFRSGVANTAFATGGLAENRGAVRPVLLRGLGPNVQYTGLDGVPVTVGGLTGSTPIIGTNELIYLGTTEGILVINPKDTADIRVFNGCSLPEPTPLPGMPSPTPIPVGPVSGTAAINLNDDVIFGTDSGQVFAFNDDGKSFTCLWMYPRAGSIPNGVVSSPLIISDAIDLTQVSTFVGIGSGHLQALNTFGTEQWRFPTGSVPFPAPLTSSVATDGVLFHVSAPDGFLYSVDRAGRLQHQARISMPITDEDTLLASPIFGTSIFGIGRGGRCGQTTQGCVAEFECSDTGCSDFGNVGVITSLNQLDEVRWRFAADAPIAGSAAFVAQSIDEAIPPFATPTPAGTPSPPVAGTPTPTPTNRAVILQGVVYIVDNNGTIYGVQDVSGELFEARTTFTPTPTFVPDVDTPTPLLTPPSDPESRLAKVQIEGPVRVTASPVLSSDLFVVFGTEDGEIYAVRLDYDRTNPCTDCDASEWEIAPFVGGGSGGGRVVLSRLAREPVVSSPTIDRDGTIYVTAGDVNTGEGTLYMIGTPPDSP